MDKKISLYKDAQGEENYRGQKKKLREDSGVYIKIMLRCKPRKVKAFYNYSYFIFSCDFKRHYIL